MAPCTGWRPSSTRAGGLLAAEIGATVFAILTDVPGVALGFGTAQERWLQDVTVSELRQHEAAGGFTAGSMGPKVDAACRYVERTGGLAVIASLESAVAAVHGAAGTRIRP